MKPKKKKETSKKRIDKRNSSPVCYTDSPEIRDDYKDQNTTKGKD